MFIKESTEQELNEELDLILSSQANAIIGFIIKWIETDFEKTPNELNELIINNFKRGYNNFKNKILIFYFVY